MIIDSIIKILKGGLYACEGFKALVNDTKNVTEKVQNSVDSEMEEAVGVDSMEEVEEGAKDVCTTEQ
ncbi:MAG: hypothetical protein K6E51_02655 [Treponema sp.]|nr:hypothetical protein [Treponema sp.]